MKPETSAVRTLRWVLIGIGLLLPMLALIPLGSLWLWQNGLLLYWAAATCATTVAAWAIQRWLLKPHVAPAASQSPPQPTDLEAGADPGWTPAELAAWRQVRDIAERQEPDAIKSREDVVALAQQTVEAVAHAMHPGKREPLLQFTAPEALALVERVSARMNTFLTENVPLGDRLTIAQLMAAWRSRGLLEVADKAYDVWRVVRMLNPASAATSEIRERLSKELMAWGKAHVLKRLVTKYVEEVGRAAIDLYGGRLQIAPGRLSDYVTSTSARDQAAEQKRVAEPLRILVAGQTSAGKSSLVNALAKEVKAAVDALPTTDRFTPYRLTREGSDAALLIDSPGITPDEKLRDALTQQAAASDLVLWVINATRADREMDRLALSALRAHFASNPQRRPPPVLLILTHVDRLRPFQEWQPPYDLGDTASVKAASIRAAIEAVAADLEFPTEAVIPASLASGLESYNIDAVWAAINERLPDAQRARLVRTLREAQGTNDWSRVWSQVKSGGRVLFDTLR